MSPGSQTPALDEKELLVALSEEARQILAELEKSGVSLDAEAVKLLQYQRAYDATAKLISILDQVTQSTLAILP